MSAQTDTKPLKYFYLFSKSTTTRRLCSTHTNKCFKSRKFNFMIVKQSLQMDDSYNSIKCHHHCQQP